MDINLINHILPFQIWALGAGLSLILVMLACGIYFWYRSRLKALVKDGEDAADLAARKVQLEAEIKHCQDWLDRNREELLRLDVERQEQERVRQDLANLENQAAQKQQEVDDFRKETNDLQNVVTVLAQDRDRLIEDLLQSIVQNEIKLQGLIAEVSAREAQHKQVQNELEQAQEKLAKIKADTVPIEELIAEKERVRKDRDDLLEEIEKHKGIKDRAQKEYEELEEKKGNLKHEVDVLNKKIIDLREEAGTGIDQADRYKDLWRLLSTRRAWSSRGTRKN